MGVKNKKTRNYTFSVIEYGDKKFSIFVFSSKTNFFLCVNYEDKQL